MQDVLASSGLVFIDKPQGCTSHDVVARARRALKTRKIGHAGTLDPMATGLLILGVERGTKFLAHMTKADKTYTTTIRLGVATDSDDATGTVIASASCADISEQDIRDAIAAHFTGTIQQRPSKVSAIKVDGKRAYQLMREGAAVELPARPVTISDFTITEITHHGETVDIVASISCSSGTYIRAIARDLGEHFQVGGHLQELRRTRIGNFSVEKAQDLETFSEKPQLTLSLDEALIANYPVLEVTASQAADLAEGKWLQPRGLREPHVAVSPEGLAIAIVAERGKRLATTFVARPKTL